MTPKPDKVNCWLNIYKPQGISSAKVVAIIKRLFPGGKVGHAGTLDVEAEGVLPIAMGEATKLVQFLIDAKKTYIFTIKFGAQTDTADASGKVIETTTNIPSKDQALNICRQFIGKISQRPNIFSAIKVNGVRSYELARKGCAKKLTERTIEIYDLKLLDFDETRHTATYVTICSKGTYIRSLAEDISLSLQSLGFVLRLARTKVGIFRKEDSINISELDIKEHGLLFDTLMQKNIRIEAILNDISVIDATEDQARRIRFGQKCIFENHHDINHLWIRYHGVLLAIGSIKENCFNSFRVFNLI